jgi:hypothetical protein
MGQPANGEPGGSGDRLIFLPPGLHLEAVPCGRSSVGRASASQAEGRRFESGRPLRRMYLVSEAPSPTLVAGLQPSWIEPAWGAPHRSSGLGGLEGKGTPPLR